MFMFGYYNEFKFLRRQIPISEGDCFGERKVDGKVCIGDTSLSKYMPKYIKPTSNRNNITRGCKTCISDMLLQSDLNK